MAIVHFINYRKAQTNAGMLFVLNYTMQDKKTVADGKKFVSGINCTPTSAYTEFRNTKKLYGKEDGQTVLSLRAVVSGWRKHYT